MIRSSLGVALCAAAATAASGQSMPDMPGMAGMSGMPSHPAPATSPPPEPMAGPMAGMASHDMSSHDMAAMPAMKMGDGVTTSGSGTSRLPAADTMRGLHIMSGDWMLMIHGYAWASWTDQGGPRGAKEAFVQSMGMIEAKRPVGEGVDLTLRTMLSLDPLMGKRGYPDLFASGETAHGLALVDRQHPHDLFMELSGRIDVETGADSRAFVYAGLPGEPALGPSAFMHRGSARFDPEAPITHHWFDSTHITYGVVTGGYATRHWQIEASAFKGREPDEDRWDIERPKLDSWSARFTWNPSRAWSAQVSYGQLHSPEGLHPEQNEHRLIASVSYSGGGVDITAGYARKAIQDGRVLPAWLAEGTWAITKRHALFGRFENVRNDELFEREEQLGLNPPLGGVPFRVSKFTAGYAYTLPLGRNVAVALGAAGNAYAKSERLDAAYGRNPHSLTGFAKLMLGR